MSAAACTLALALASFAATGESRAANIESQMEIKLPGDAITAVKAVHPWAGKRVAYFGDSISDPALTFVKKRYWDFLKEWLGITPYVYAVNGRQWDDVPRQEGELLKEHGQDVDAIIIFMGTNDFNTGVPIGSYFTEKVEEVKSASGEVKPVAPRKHRTLSMDASTLCGRINIAMSKIRADYPTKQVVILTPIHRGFAEFGPGNMQPDEFYPNAAGRWFEEYINVIKQASGIWSVPVIDLYSISGVCPALPSEDMYVHDAKTDRLHPNDEGHKRIAKTLMYQLLALPCTY